MTLPRSIYMVGIGGIGMSALAQYLVHTRHEVAGSDRDDSPTVELLRSKGVDVAIGQGALPQGAEMLIYSDAVPESHPVRTQAREKNVPQLSYFDALGELSRGKRTIAVAGTHGKTTTTAMLTSILERAGKHPTAFIGSIVRDFDSNFVAGSEELFVIEACEYRDHVLKLSPEILVITNVELDHTDYFPDIAALKQTFRLAASRVPPEGLVVADLSDPHTEGALHDMDDVRVLDYRRIEVPRLKLIGEFNKMNARAAKTAALAAFPDIASHVADEALASFQGSWRRFEYRGETPQGAMVYDDYAHHPTAIKKTIEAAREKFPEKKIVIAFHPHLYSRTKSLLKEFADALATADVAIVAPIYAARETPDSSISHRSLAIAASEKGGDAIALDSFDDIRDRLLQEEDDAIIITMGAGDIYKVAEQIAD